MDVKVGARDFLFCTNMTYSCVVNALLTNYNKISSGDIRFTC